MRETVRRGESSQKVNKEQKMLHHYLWMDMFDNRKDGLDVFLVERLSSLAI